MRELDEIRERLAVTFKINNPSLSGDQLTEVTQKTIDRLVFMRFLEDKLIEQEPVFENFTVATSDPWRSFTLKSRALDRVYNGVIFKHHNLLDSVDFRVDTNVFQSICDELSSDESPYDFNTFPIHILGSIYERFLGKVITVDENTQSAQIEEKLEVRKAGGVYYTPEYIVSYIIENTIGKIIEGKSPEQIARMRFADISCGSGSFLIGAYDYLLRYHTRFYNKAQNRNKGLKAGCLENENGTLRLSLRQRKKILLNNLYGVDIDAQAVEVAQLSLFLKLLEEETTNSARGYQLEFRETMLPSLDKNIVQGNSLIEWDIMDNLFVDEELKKLYPFNFSHAFPDVIKEGGFNAIFGNPPYGRLLDGHAEKYTSQKLQAFKSVKDIYVAFMERSPQLIRDNGLLSFIVPSAWLGGSGYKKLRNIIGNYAIKNIILLPFNVFKDAYVDTSIFVLSKTTPLTNHNVRNYVYAKKARIQNIDINNSDWNKIPLSTWLNTEDQKFILSKSSLSVITRLRSSLKSTIGDFIEMKRGVLFDRKLLTDSKISEKSFPYFEGDVYRYQLNQRTPQWIEYGSQMREYPRDFKWFEGNRILMRRLVNRQKRLMSCVTKETFITNKNLYSLLVKPDLKLTEDFTFFALGVLNSKLISMLYIEQVSQASKDDFPQVTIKDVLNLPLPSVNKSVCEKMSRLVKQILEANTHRSKFLTDKDLNFYEKKILVLENQIDELVYEIYKIIPNEIIAINNFLES